MVVMNRGSRSLATPVHETATGSLEKSAEGALHAAFVFAMVVVLTAFLCGRWLGKVNVHVVCVHMTAADALQRGRLAAASLGRFFIGRWETYESELKEACRRKECLTRRTTSRRSGIRRLLGATHIFTGLLVCKRENALVQVKEMKSKPTREGLIVSITTRVYNGRATFVLAGGFRESFEVFCDSGPQHEQCKYI